MALKAAALFLLATFLLVATRVSADDDEQLYMEAAYAKVTVPAPAPAPAPPVKAPAPAPPVTEPPVKPPVAAPMPPVKSRKDCTPLCGQRCRLHSRQGLCLRACMTCCDRCKCVPPGTYGNKEKCGKCYTGMTTRRNKPKCP